MNPTPITDKSSLEEYYEKNYPTGKPFRLLDKDELREVRRDRRAYRWKNLKVTVMDIVAVFRFVRGFLK